MRLLLTGALFLLTSLTTYAAPSTDSYCKVAFNHDGDKGTYKGQCLNNTPHGSGSVTLHTGDVIEGKFINGQIDGEATFKSASGNVYKGMWVNGKRHGEGTYEWAQGSSYTGEWFDDKRHGKGTFRWSNGNRFEGEFRNGKKYNGKYYTHTGRVYKCRLGQCR